MNSDAMMALIIGSSVVLGLLVVVGIPVALGIRHSRYLREIEHAERMRAMELGQPPPGDQLKAQELSGVVSPGVKIGLSVPLGAMGIAFGTSLMVPWLGENVIAVWSAAGAIGVAGIICGTILTLRMPPPVVSQPEARPAGSYAKPAFDPEALGIDRH